MPGYNTKFELTVDDMELIEDALRTSRPSCHFTRQRDFIYLDGKDVVKNVYPLERINDLLGRLHNQKNFYRPKSGAYIGG